MTREEAIAYAEDYLKDLISACCHIEEKHKDFVKMAIKALEQEPCVDAVSRTEVKNKAIQIWNGGGDENYKFSTLIDYITDECKAPSEWQQDHAILKAHSDGANEVIDRIKEAREELQNLRGCSCSCSDGIIDDVEDIFDKLIAEVEG